MLRIGLICVIMVQVASGQGTLGVTPAPAPTPYKPITRKLDRVKACDLALNACLKTVQAQDSLVVQLKADKQKLADQLAQANQQPLLPTWAWVTIGVLAGAVVGAKVLK